MTETSGSSQTGARAGTDPRRALFRAVALAGETIAAVRPEQYGNTSPCPDFSARQLVQHLIAVLRRVCVAGSGGHPFTVASFAEDVPEDQWQEAWDGGVRDAEAVWSDPAVLGKAIELGFATVPGAAACIVYTTEISLHTWDLAKATGQSPAWEAEALAAPVAAMRHAVPAEPRGGPVPFGPVVEVPVDAPLIDQLAGWYGRQP